MTNIKFNSVDTLSKLLKLISKIDDYVLITNLSIRKIGAIKYSVDITTADDPNLEKYLTSKWKDIINDDYHYVNFSYYTFPVNNTTSPKDTPISLFGVKKRKKLK